MKNGYYLEGTGTAWSLMTEGCKKFGVRGEELPLDQGRIMAALDAGHPIICSLRPEILPRQDTLLFWWESRTGQLCGTGSQQQARSEKLWDYDRLASQMKNLWAFTKK